MLGLGLGRWGWATNWQLIWSTSLTAFVCLFWQPRWFWLALITLGLNLGLWRAQIVLDSYQPLVRHYGQEVNVQGKVADDPTFTDNYQAEFHVDHLSIHGASGWTEVGGRLKVRGYIFEKLNRSDQIAVKGRLDESLGNRQGQIYYGQVKIVSRSTSKIESWRKRFFAGVYTALPEPVASLGLGLVAGTRTLLPDSLVDKLSITGLTHIVAVSGFNLTILIRFARRLFNRFSKYWAAIGSLALIGLFLAITGLSSSIFRAALVAGLAIWAWYYGRPIKASILILVPASVTAWVSPSYLWFDVGWYLSFLAFYGVLVVAPILMSLLARGHRVNSLVQIFIETTSAQLMALPFIVWVFGEFSAIAPLTNLLILPLVPLTMLGVLVAGIGGMLVPALAGWLAWPARQLLTLIVRYIDYFGSFKFAKLELTLVTPIMIIIYAGILLVVGMTKIRLGRKIDKKYSIIA